MSADEPKPRLALAVEPLDEGSRFLVPRSDVEMIDGRTAQRDEDLPSTEPDGNASLTRDRDSVISALRQLEDERQKTPRDARVPEPVDLIAPDRPTQPARAAVAPSDVFAPLGARERIMDADAATPPDRPFRHIGDDKPTDLDPRHAPTLTLQQKPVDKNQLVERTEPLERPSPARRESDQERLLVRSIYETERAYEALKDLDPPRATHVASLRDHLMKSPAYSERDLVLAEHIREKRALQNATDAERDERENRVMAVGLVARQLDDRYRDQISEHRDRLVAELKALAPAKQNAVFADFESFAERGDANDSNYCRRELHRALKQELELHKAYVYALALDKKQQRAPLPQQRPFVDDDASNERAQS